MSKEELNRKIAIWTRLSNDPQIMEVAKGLVFEVLDKLRNQK